ncbi:MAG TPA: Crp/Fnr family transcriptional regulator [Candidatus Saccharimonadales bacterium]|nr:Crp/Fnr family transcriptional regulator [Candidatus Saccharimonadales bacterium]
MDELQKFITQHPLKKFDRDQVILCQGDAPSVVYAIRKGFIKGYDINSQGTEQLVWFGTPGDICPSVWLFSSDDSLPLFYSSFSRVEAYVLDKEEVLEFLHTHPNSLMKLTKRLAVLASDLIARLNAVEKPKAEEKIAHTLAFFADRFAESKRSGVRRISLPFTQQDLASLLGLTRETVAKELKRLKEEKYISYNRWRFVVYRDRIDELL